MITVTLTDEQARVAHLALQVECEKSAFDFGGFASRRGLTEAEYQPQHDALVGATNALGRARLDT